MNDDDRLDDLSEDEFVRDLLGHLELDAPAPPDQLADRTIRKVQAELTSRDLVDLTTFVFLMRFCAPLLDLLAAFFGHDPLSPPESMAAPRGSETDSPSRDRTGAAAPNPAPWPSLDRSDPDE